MLLRSLSKPPGRHRAKPKRRFAPAAPAVAVAVVVLGGVPLLSASAGARDQSRVLAPQVAVAAPVAAAAPLPAAASTTTSPARPQTRMRSNAVATLPADEMSQVRAHRTAAQPVARRRSTLDRASRSRRTAPPKPTVTPKAAPKAAPKVEQQVEQQPVEESRPGWVRPARGAFTSGFKWRWGRQHKGVDIAAPTGTPILAAADGVVIQAGWNGGYGKFVAISHGDGVVTRYAHNSAILVGVGERVGAGEQISRMGSTGNSTGPHLHFEVRINGEAIDPYSFLARRGIRL